MRTLSFFQEKIKTCLLNSLMAGITSFPMFRLIIIKRFPINYKLIVIARKSPKRRKGIDEAILYFIIFLRFLRPESSGLGMTFLTIFQVINERSKSVYSLILLCLLKPYAHRKSLCFIQNSPVRPGVVNAHSPVTTLVIIDAPAQG
jgi:hypothetical protein